MKPLTLILFISAFLTASSQNVLGEKIRLGDVPEEPLTHNNDKVDQSNASPGEGLSRQEKQRLVDEVADEFYQKGQNALKAGKLEQAEGYFDRVLILNPHHKKAKERIELIMKAYEDTSAGDEKQASKMPKNALIKKLLREMNQNYENKRWEKTHLSAKKILAIDPENAKAKNKIKSINRQLHSHYVDQAEELDKTKRFEKAIGAYMNALNFKKDPNIQLKINALNKKIGIKNKNRSEALYLEALTASQNSQTKTALALCKKALQLDNQNLQAKRMLERLKSRDIR